jgi:cytochrome c oxidase cbb3-type subunit 1
MSAVAAPLSSVPSVAENDLKASASADQKVALERSAIDSAVSGPVLGFFTVAIGWLLISTLLGLITSIKLHQPGFLADCPFVTYGRVSAAYRLALTYGWASLSGMGVAIWLMSRLCRVPVRFPGALSFGNLFWNTGLVLAIGSVLSGKTSAVAGLDIPSGPAALMFIGYLFVGAWGGILYRARRSGPAYISVWYLLGAFFWFPWFFGVSHYIGWTGSLHGVMNSILAAWYQQGLSLFWLGAVGLAAAYYLIPKVINRSVYSYNLASIGFWSFAFLGGLTSLVRLSGGPVPAWMVTVSIAATIVMLIPVLTVMVNFIATLRGHSELVYCSPTLRFAFFGTVAFGVANVLALVSSFRGIDRVVHFTQFVDGQYHVLVYSFFSMVMFGAIYYITPRLVGCEWLSSTLIKFHFWGSAYGGSLLAGLLLIAGVFAGVALGDPDATFTQALQVGQSYYFGQSLAYGLIGVGHWIFSLHFLLMLLRIGQPGSQPTRFTKPGVH